LRVFGVAPAANAAGLDSEEMAAADNVPGGAQPSMTESRDDMPFDIDFSQFDDLNRLNVVGQFACSSTVLGGLGSADIL
jgi:hypothetical protein